MNVREIVWVGVDVGKSHRHACAVDATCKTVFSRKLVNGQGEIEALVAKVHRAADQVRWAVDMTCGGAGLLPAALATTDEQVVYAPISKDCDVVGMNRTGSDGGTSNRRCNLSSAVPGWRRNVWLASSTRTQCSPIPMHWKVSNQPRTLSGDWGWIPS